MIVKRIILAVCLVSLFPTASSPLSYQEARLIPMIGGTGGLVAGCFIAWQEQALTSAKNWVLVGGAAAACWGITKFLCWRNTPAQLLKRARAQWKQCKREYKWLFSANQVADFTDIGLKKLIKKVNHKYCSHEFSLIDAANDLSNLKNDLDFCIELLTCAQHTCDAEKDVKIAARQLLDPTRNGPGYYQGIVADILIALKQDPLYSKQLAIIEQRRLANATQKAANAQHSIAVTETIKVFSRFT